MMDINESFFSKITDLKFNKSGDNVEVKCRVWGGLRSDYKGDVKLEVKTAKYLPI